MFCFLEILDYVIFLVSKGGISTFIILCMFRHSFYIT